jgi:hypothetical protein
LHREGPRRKPEPVIWSGVAIGEARGCGLEGSLRPLQCRE